MSGLDFLRCYIPLTEIPSSGMKILISSRGRSPTEYLVSRIDKKSIFVIISDNQIIEEHKESEIIWHENQLQVFGSTEKYEFSPFYTEELIQTFSYSVFPVTQIPEHIEKTIEKTIEDDFDILVKVLDLPGPIDEIPFDIEFLNEYNPTEIDKTRNEKLLTEKCRLFIPDVYSISLDDNNLRKMLNLASLLGEQQEYFIISNLEESEKNSCSIEFIGASAGDHYLGGIFLFSRPDWNFGFLQGISKSLVYFLPELTSSNKIFPSLNSILFPRIELLAQNKGLQKLYVRPIGKQGNILKKHYGFQETDEFVRKPFPF